MTDFEDRLQQAVNRGQQRKQERLHADAQAAMTEEEYKQLHSKYRLQVSDHIEECVKQLPNHFPGFQIETIYGERGWGAAAYRDDLKIQGGRRDNAYSRLELTVRPFSSYHVLDLAGKGAIDNKEMFNRNYFEKLGEVDPQTFLDLVDGWIVEFAELYAARQ